VFWKEDLRDVVINDVTLMSLKTPQWSRLVFCDDFVTILFWSLWWRHICSSVTNLVFSSKMCLQSVKNFVSSQI
jgi:hypothetical protein